MNSSSLLDMQKDNQVSGRIERTEATFERLALPHSFSSEYLGSVHGLPLETTLILLEEYRVQPCPLHLHDRRVSVVRGNFLAERERDVSLQINSPELWLNTRSRKLSKF